MPFTDWYFVKTVVNFSISNFVGIIYFRQSTLLAEQI